MKKPYKIIKTNVDVGRGRKMEMEEARTLDGHYIGDRKTAFLLWKKYGIERFELRTPKSLVCSVGYNPEKKLWYGWSHRAISGFKTRQAAARFAEKVS